MGLDILSLTLETEQLCINSFKEKTQHLQYLDSSQSLNRYQGHAVDIREKIMGVNKQYECLLLMFLLVNNTEN